MTLKQRFGKWLIPRMPFNRRTFDILRFELNATMTTILGAVSPRLRKARAQLAGKRHLSINVGSGGRGHAEWVNIDIGRHHQDQTFPCDIRRGLPFKDGQVARIFAEHIIEHIEFRQDIPRLLREFYRVLELGGRVRIIVPDGERYLHAYVTGDPQEWAALGIPKLPLDMPTPMTMVNHVFHQNGEHFFAYDYVTMAFVLKSAGFSKTSKMAFGVSDDSKLAIDREEHAKYSLYVEAQK